MSKVTKQLTPRLALVATAVALFVAQWLCGDFPQWLFVAPMNIVVGVLWLALVAEGYRRSAQWGVVRYLLSPEATYVALAVAALVAALLGLQSEPRVASWPMVGAFVYMLTVLTLVILRGWRNAKGVRWRFVILHGGLLLAVASALLGAPDKEVLRVQVGETPTREAVNARGERRYLDYELQLRNFEMEQSDDGTPQMFRATVAVGDEVVDIEVNSPYSQSYGEDIYLVSYAAGGCVLQVVREPWRAVTATGVAMLLLGAFMLFLQGFGVVRQ